MTQQNLDTLMPFYTHNFKVFIKDDIILTKNLIKITPVFQDGKATLEIHVRDAMIATLPELLFGLTAINATTDIRLEQLDRNHNVVRNTIFHNCTINSITQSNLDYAKCAVSKWIIKATTNTVTASKF
jgi:hypothetical protein